MGTWAETVGTPHRMTLHIVPLGDVVERATTDDCVCGPTDQPVKQEDGSVRWLVVHHSADGSEAFEADPVH